jgi:hypothetical protein
MLPENRTFSSRVEPTSGCSGTRLDRVCARYQIPGPDPIPRARGSRKSRATSASTLQTRSLRPRHEPAGSRILHGEKRVPRTSRLHPGTSTPSPPAGTGKKSGREKKRCRRPRVCRKIGPPETLPVPTRGILRALDVRSEKKAAMRPEPGYVRRIIGRSATRIGRSGDELSPPGG